MDLNIPELSDDYNYSHYYDYGDEPLDGFGLCEKAHVKVFGRIFLPVSYIIICTLSIIVNILFISTLIKSKHHRKTFPMNMAISDMLFALTLPFWAVYAHNEWIFGNDSCKTVTAIYITTLYSSILFITCISVDRYLGVVWTLSSWNHCTPMENTLVSFVVWSLSILAAAPHWTFVQEQEFHGQKICMYPFGEENHLPLWKILMKFQLNVFGFLTPFLIMLFCYLRVCCAVAKVKVGPRRKSLKLVMIVVVVFFVLWFPYNIVSFLHSLQHLHVISNCATSLHLDFAIQVTEVIAYSHGFVNPIVYAFVNKRVWKGFATMCGGKCRRRTSDEYVLECSDSTKSMSVQSGVIELQAVQSYLENNTHQPTNTEQR
ncbi:atypical chemokine receptor 2 [Oncorhynchus mykiss]|uniref:CBP2 n=2 Tax=Oncorhynchus mykiss TaxID=8022 RepID=A0A0H4CYF8_ONCMY|nr:atypical chemokine receptor 2 [Oncorhynchus mykiss]AKN81085.1 CBP2 [Oncorhynchus mykiss]